MFPTNILFMMLTKIELLENIVENKAKILKGAIKS